MRVRQGLGAALAWLGARDGLVRVAAFVAAFAVLIAPADFAARHIFGQESGLLGHTGPGRLVVCALLLALALLFNRSCAQPHPFGLRPFPGWRITLGRGWLFGIGGYLAYALLMRLGGAVEFRAPSSLPDAVVAVPICALAGVAIATVEETLFRGFLLRTAAEALPRWPAVIFTGILFAFFHDIANPGDLLTEPADRMLFGGVFCLHLLLCASAIQTRSLHLGIGIHAGLVFGEALFRRLRLFKVINDDSWFLGLDGDPRRGFIAWGLFVASALLVRRLMGKRVEATRAGRTAITFAAKAPPWLLMALQRMGAIGPRGEAACWLSVAAVAIAVRFATLVGIPFALTHDRSISLLRILSDLIVVAEPRGGWLTAGLLATLAPHSPALGALVWLQHGAVLLGLAAMFLALRLSLGRWAVIPLAACALGCGLHGMPIYVAHHVLPGSLQFTLNAIAISLWALRLGGRSVIFAFAAALVASTQGFDGFLAWPLVATIILRELIAPRDALSRLIASAATACGAALPIVTAAYLAPTALHSYANPSPQIPSIFTSVAHLDPELAHAPPKVREAIAPFIEGTAAMPPSKRRTHLRTTVLRALDDIEPDPARHDALCLELTLGILKRKPLAACATWADQCRTLLCRGSENTDYPGEPDLQRTARYTRRWSDGPAVEIHRRAIALLPRFEGQKPIQAPEWLVWFLAILPPILTTTLLLAAATGASPPAARWLAIGCLAAWLPAIARLSLVDDVSGREIVAVLPIAMFTLSAAVALGCRAAAAALRGADH